MKKTNKLECEKSFKERFWSQDSILIRTLKYLRRKRKNEKTKV